MVDRTCLLSNRQLKAFWQRGSLAHRYGCEAGSNNPVMNAVVDVLACFQLNRRQIQVLSLGCGETTFKVDDQRARGGFLHWWNVIQAAMRAQSLNSLGQAYLLVGKDHVLRLDAPESPRPIALDDHRRAKEELPAMARSLVEGAGREMERVFFADLADRYEPCAAVTQAA